ncbi:DUF6270 domain-containing protein [Brevibacterium sp. UCMA 11752]|uniref:DUF6270 domain-containing protein n=1 Tax=Brevibacterium sp. UCMA 11752 TaxID=2745946 RepID=UPI001F21D2F4|nr:DUF6270 domain-containing protein [Brevibacterium sp. UCMA 11752]MCF2585823.1 hypothetical protein [Brevibacterium sp. UCMA 11752]
MPSSNTSATVGAGGDSGQSNSDATDTSTDRYSSKRENETKQLKCEINEVRLMKNGVLHCNGYAVVLGHSSDRYGLTKNRLILTNEDAEGDDYWYPLATIKNPSLTHALDPAGRIDYSHGAVTTLGEAGINLSSLPPGKYTVGLSIERAEGVYSLQNLQAPEHMNWTLAENAALGSVSDGKKWTLYRLPVPGRSISDAYFESTQLEIEKSKLYLQGYFVPHGKDFPAWGSIQYYLSMASVDKRQGQVTVELANGNRPNAQVLTGDSWRDQSKAYYATPKYEGLDLTNILPGNYVLSITGRVGDDVFTRYLDEKLNVKDPQYQNEDKLPTVSIIGSCVTRDNFNGEISPFWKSLWQIESTFYQSSIISLMSESIEVSEQFYDGLNVHDKEVVTRDLSKSFLGELVTDQPDILLVDLFADTRFGVLEIENSWITNNEWKLPNANGYQDLNSHRRVNGQNAEDEFFSLFKNKCAALRLFLDENLPNTVVCLNSARNVYMHRGINTNGQKFSYEHILQLNQLWSRLDEQFIQTMNPLTVDSMAPGLQADSHHRWGPGPVHYEKAYYSSFHSRLRKGLGREMMFSIIR